MQVVILAGGLGTRLRPLTNRVPKSLIEIQGRPFLDYQIELLKHNEINDIVLCVGHLAEQIKDYFRDGKRFGVDIQYSEEDKELLGTAGALKKAGPLLEETFFVLDGDSYLPLDYAEVMSYFKERDRLALLVVYRNYNRYDRSNVVIDAEMVKVYSREKQVPGMIYIHAGLSIVTKEALALVPDGQPVSQDELWSKLVSRNELLAFETDCRFYEVGSFSGLEEFRQLMGQRGNN
jgi:MurNAc alpha-1-phosphate uridylyltransferase